MTHQQLIEIIDSQHDFNTLKALGSHLQQLAYHLPVEDDDSGEFGAFLLILEVFLKQFNEAVGVLKDNLGEVDTVKVQIVQIID